LPITRGGVATRPLTRTSIAFNSAFAASNCSAEGRAPSSVRGSCDLNFKTSELIVSSPSALSETFVRAKRFG
jgi:hypothetical protein